MNYKLVLTLAFFVLLAFRSYCQGDFRSGYVINNGHDTIRGQLDYRSNANNYKSCIFRNEQGQHEYFPDEILGFGYDNDKFFSSRIVKGTFVEVLVLGELSLYKSKDKYHLKKDSIIYDLELSYEEVKLDGRVYKQENNRWRGIISFLISDCIINSNSAVSRIRFDEKSITKVIIKYNDCRGVEFVDFKEDKPWIAFNYGVSVGLVKSEHDLFHQTAYYGYIVNTYNSTDPSVGLVLGVSAPRISEKLSFQYEIHFFCPDYSSFVERKNGSTTEYHETSINLKVLSLPLSIKYAFSPEKKYDFYLQGGANIDFQLDKKTSVFTQIVEDNVVYNYFNDQPFRFKTTQFGIWGGAGVIKSYQKFKVGLEIRYLTSSGIKRGSSIFNRLTLNLIIRK